MKLIELNPTFEQQGEFKYLCFDCPVCKTHRLEVPLPPHPKAWNQTGDRFEIISLHPSILHKTHYADGTGKDGQSGRFCESHFFITEGEIKMA